MRTERDDRRIDRGDAPPDRQARRRPPAECVPRGDDGERVTRRHRLRLDDRCRSLAHGRRFLRDDHAPRSELPVRARRRPKSHRASSDAAQRASRCTQRSCARVCVSAAADALARARRGRELRFLPRKAARPRRQAAASRVFQRSEVVLAFLRHSREAVEIRHRVVEYSSSRGGSRSARRSPPRRAHEAAARASAPATARATARDANLELQDCARRLPATARDRAGLRSCAPGGCEPMIDRVQPEHRGTRSSFDLGVVRAQRRDVMRRIGSAERRCNHYCGCQGDKRQKPPARHVCLPKHEGRTVPQLGRRKAASRRRKQARLRSLVL